MFAYIIDDSRWFTPFCQLCHRLYIRPYISFNRCLRVCLTKDGQERHGLMINDGQTDNPTDGQTRVVPPCLEATGGVELSYIIDKV